MSAPSPDLAVVETRVYRGHNYWSRGPAINLLVDLGSLEDWPSDRLPAVMDALLERLPGLARHTCSDTGSLLGPRLREGTGIAHVVQHAALELQQEAGFDTRRGKTKPGKTPRQHHVVYAYVDEQVGTAAGQLAIRLLNDLVSPDPAFDYDAGLERFLLDAERTAFGPSTQALLDEAGLRDIPFIRLNEGSLVQLGQGVYAKRIRATMTSGTSALATDIAGDKSLTLRLLANAGLPVPRSEVVRHDDDAVAFAKRIGYPVVVKPLDGNHGRGVGLDLRDEQAVRDAFPFAQGEARRGWVIVEQYLTGSDYRFLVVGGRLAACAERVPAHVVGDGVQSVRNLVAETNADPRRGVGHEKVLTRIKLDERAEELVRSQGYELDDVPEKGAAVTLTLTANMSTGGISIDRTLEVHPDNVEIAENAARVVGLDVAGIDFVAPDITQSVREAGGAIVEVNAAPGFRMHTHPTVGEPQYVAKPVLDLLFPPGSPSRIPIIGVTGTNGKTTTSRMIAHVFKGMGRTVGMTSTDGIVVDERLVIRADASGPKSARMVLQNPSVDFAVFEVARGGILREGLGYERNDVAVVLNVAPDHLGIGGVDTLEELARVKRVVVEAVPRDGFAVLNADDPLVAAMGEVCAGEVVWFSMQARNDLVEEHCHNGGRAVVLERSALGDMVVIRHGRRSMQLAWTHLLPATFDGKALMNVQNAMAAAGAAFAAGAHLHDIRQGLRTFTTSFYLAPGRLNVTDIDGIRVVVDYCHNAPGMRMLGDFVERLAEPRPGGSIEKTRRIGVISTAGDRRDEDMRELGEAAAPHFDSIIVREDRNLRRRKPGETAALVADGVRGAKDSRCRDLEIVLDELASARRAMEKANPGDLVVICADQTGAVWAELQAHSARALAGAADPDARP
ncbi:MAG TPA: cyanophycin synthetase [Frankiaceae bacterium]|nr:cyanophycin synthetase [Frankiaceae bacterium]